MAISGEQKRLEIIRQILKDQPSTGPNALARLVVSAEDADDCAIYDLPGNLSLVVGMDFVRGPNFLLFQEKQLDFFDIGYYLVVANLSDIAAMGATPIGLTTIIRYPDSLEDNEFTQLMEGIKEAASYYNTPIVGGDIGGYPEMVLAATALGTTAQGKYLKRRGTIEGDVLCMIGYAGLPSTALVYFKRAKKAGFLLSTEEEQILLSSWKRPKARIKEGLALAELGVVHACQDVSDGVRATIDQLSEASMISFEIYEQFLPIHPITYKVAAFLNVDPIALAFSASVDFQLMFTVPFEDFGAIQNALHPSEEPVQVENQVQIIGKAIPRTNQSRLLRSNGEKFQIPGTAWNQQTNDVTTVILQES